MEAVEGKLVYPEKPGEDEDASKMDKYQKQVDVLEKKEFLAQNIIVSSVSSQVRQLINMCSTAQEMWGKLLSIFEQRTEQRQDRLFNEFFGIKEKDSLDSVVKHIAKLEKLWVELQDETWKEDKVKLPDSLFLNRVLNTLPCEYSEFINAWESVPKDLRTLSLLRERDCVRLK
ncbi:uncharacterized protein LOC128996161 [Macrosteles quadrilineatus]|uniref:uncharacterized protein LOC128996161 n=1 Tax=Macrosteles quadrilineatus TaxID=74068 RepID=UPI0023E0ADD1|nr:uncharacterized protein LOC128996161 [Macrosteles quadrilineatus]